MKKNNKKKILYVEANEDGTIGGSHYCLLEIVKELDPDKYLPVVCFYQDNNLVPEFKKYVEVLFISNPRGIVFESRFPGLYRVIGKSSLLRGVLSILQKSYNLIRYELMFYINVVGFIIKHKIKIIHINNAPILTQWLVASKILRVPCVAHVRGNMALGSIQRKLVPKYDCIISISDAVTKFANMHGIDTGKFLTIHDGIDIESVKKMHRKSAKEVFESLNIPYKKQIIGVVGNIKDWKGQHVLVDAVSVLIYKYPDITCLIIGAVSDLTEDKDYFHLLQQKISDNHLVNNVLFTGYRNDVADIISVLDVMIHTSTAPEPLGRVVLEGMLFGKPVVATAHGGPLEIIENNISGILVPPGDPEMLAKAIDNILSNDEFRKKLCEQAIERVNEKFSIESNVRQIEEQYENL